MSCILNLVQIWLRCKTRLLLMVLALIHAGCSRPEAQNRSSEDTAAPLLGRYYAMSSATPFAWIEFFPNGRFISEEKGTQISGSWSQYGGRLLLSSSMLGTDAGIAYTLDMYPMSLRFESDGGVFSMIKGDAGASWDIAAFIGKWAFDGEIEVSGRACQLQQVICMSENEDFEELARFINHEAKSFCEGKFRGKWEFRDGILTSRYDKGLRPWPWLEWDRTRVLNVKKSKLTLLKIPDGRLEYSPRKNTDLPESPSGYVRKEWGEFMRLMAEQSPR
jgi:hypothetical protein